MKKTFGLLMSAGLMCGLLIAWPEGAAGAGRSWSVSPDKLAAEAKKLDADSPWKGAPFFCYVVPAISPVRRMPDALPPDGVMDNKIRIVGAMGEFVPASFLVAPLKDISKLELKASALRPAGKEGGSRRSEIPAENVSVKVVKCWWQHGTAWHGYHQDKCRRELVPELLLNDDTLIKVDLEDEEHYLRVDYPDGPRYVWISYEYPQGAETRSQATHPTLPVGSYFDFRKEPVADSPVLLPVKLHQGRLQQFWITVRIPEKAGAGIYEGDITLTADGAAIGKITLALRVLPFTLPDPRTYYDLDRDFLVSIDGVPVLEREIRDFGGDREMAEKRVRNLLKNQREHNMFNYHVSGAGWHSYATRSTDMLTADLKLQKEAGFKPPLFGVMSAAVTGFSPKDEYPEIFEKFKKNLAGALNLVESITGSRDVFLWGWGEPGRKRVKDQLDGWHAAHEMGAMVGSEGKPWHFPIAGYAEDLAHLGGAFYDREYTAPWHALGQRVTAYANPHPGAENPDMSRRIHGMMLYKNWFDGTKNNTWGAGDDWLTFRVSYAYRIRLVYTTRTDVIDTIHWEGFREGIDDVRYATKLKMLAAEAIASGNIDAVYAAKKALLWLELNDAETADLNAMRLEMINYIMKLKSLLEA